MKDMAIINMKDYEEFKEHLKWKAYALKLKEELDWQTSVLDSVDDAISDIADNIQPGSVNLDDDGDAIHGPGEIGYEIQGWINYISDNGHRKGHAKEMAEKMGLEVE